MYPVHIRRWRRGGLLLLVLLPLLYWLGLQSWETGPTPEVIARWKAARLAHRAAETNYPTTQAVTLTCTSKKSTYRFGERQQWIFLFSNASPETVYFSDTKTNGSVARRDFTLTMVRENGEDFITGSALCREQDNLQLEPGQTKTMEYPPPTRETFRSIDEYTPLPGSYVFRAKIWMHLQVQRERLLSAEQHFKIVDDGSGDVQKVMAARSGRGVRENLELIICRTNSTLIELSARNRGQETLYLGSGWSWWSKSSWEEAHEDFGGLGAGGILELPPGEMVQIRGMSFRDHVPDGFRAVEARYYAVNGAGPLKTSNRIYVWVNGPVSRNIVEFAGNFFQALEDQWTAFSKHWKN